MTTNFSTKINYAQLNKQWQANVIKARQKVTGWYGRRMVENRSLYLSAQKDNNEDFDVELFRNGGGYESEQGNPMVFTQEEISCCIEEGKAHFLVKENELNITIEQGMDGVKERDKAYGRGKLGEVLDYDAEVCHVNCTIKSDGTFKIWIDE